MLTYYITNAVIFFDILTSLHPKYIFPTHPPSLPTFLPASLSIPMFPALASSLPTSCMQSSIPTNSLLYTSETAQCDTNR